jgi:hypothetical protein
VDGRIERYKPPYDRYPEEADWKPQAHVCEPHIEMERVFEIIKHHFKDSQFQHVSEIL